MEEPEPLFAEFPPVDTEAWEDRIRADLGEEGFDELTWELLDDLHLAPFYREEDLPGEHPALDAAPGWQLRQDVSAGSPDALNRQIRSALDGGVGGLGLAPDVDDDVLRGVPVQSTDDTRRLLAGVPLSGCAWHLGGPAALPLLALLLHEAERRSEAGSLRGTLAFDPPAELARFGTLDLQAAYTELAALLRKKHEVLSGFRLVAVDLTPYHEAGASPDLELALACAAMAEHTARLTDAGCPAYSVLAQMHVAVEVGRSYFPEVAKLRALRLLYQQMSRAFLNEDDPSPPPLHVQALTSRRDRTLYAPPTNVLRHTTEASAAVIGSADVVQVHPHDAVSGATDSGRRLARNTQHLLREEAHLDRIADPAAGSYYVEVLTDKLARRAWAQFQAIEARGGLLESLQKGFVQECIAEARRRTAEAVEAGDAPFVGTTLHPIPDEKRLRETQPDAQSVPLQTTGTGYDRSAPLSSRCAALRDGAALGALLPARTDGTIEPLPAGRWSSRWTAPFERLRLRTERYAETHDGAPTVLLLPWGERAVRSARANFARGFFGVAGLAVEEARPFDASADAARAAVAQDSALVVLCSSDDAYAEGASFLRRALRARNADTLLVVAGAPQETVAADVFIHRKSPLLKTLRDVQQRLGMMV